MKPIKLNHEQNLILSEKLNELNAIHQESTSKEVFAYQEDWASLDRAIKLAILQYRHILNTNELVSGK